MPRRIGLFAAWIAVTGVSVLLATQAVGTVRDAVTDAPATLATVASAAVGVDTTTTTAAVVPTTDSTPVTTTAPPAIDTSTSTTESPTTATTTTTAPPTTPAPATTTTAAPPAMETATYQLVGGWVRIRFGGGEVYLVDAGPNAGYSIDPEKTGPLKVEVEFSGPDDYEGKFVADMEDGPLDVEIEEDGDED